MELQQQPFDILAETYDEDFSHSLIGKLQREQVWKYLLPILNTVNRPLNILEINCGTGEDAIRLAQMGHRVVAADASGIMIAKARQKADSAPGTKTLQLKQCRFEELGSCTFDTHFDLVFSNFGGLNCIDANALKELAITLEKLTHSRSHLFFVIMGNFCLWETGYYLFRGKLRTAFRRWRRQVSFEAGGKNMPVYYYSRKAARKIFEPSFAYCNSHAVGLFIPPSYLEPFFKKHQSLLKRFNFLENKLARFAFTSALSDHYCIVFKKVHE